MTVKPKTPSWGYAKGDKAQIFELGEGEELPEGFYPHPALVPGSKAEKRHKEEADREGAKVVLK